MNKNDDLQFTPMMRGKIQYTNDRNFMEAARHKIFLKNQFFQHLANLQVTIKKAPNGALK